MNKHQKNFELSDQEIKNALVQLKQFKIQHKLRQSTYSYIVTHLLTKQEKLPFTRLFQKIDQDQDGLISKKELMAGFGKYFGHAISKEEADKIFSNIGVSDSEVMEYTQFIMACIPEKVVMTNEHLASVFKVFDKDGSGEICKDEIKQVFGDYNHKISDDVA